jgi:histidinol-phosphatase (PHP family)
MIVDYHIHTRASPDAKSTMKECVEAAVRRGIDEVGFSDHMLLREDQSRYPALPPERMSEHVEEVHAFRDQSELPVKLGLEMDFFPEEVEKTREFIGEYPFDYVIGSVHYISNWLIDSSEQKAGYAKTSIDEVYEEYFRLVRRLCESRLFDILGHADLVKIFGFRPKTDFSGMLRETAEAAARADICVEINTAGLRRPCSEMYPSEQFLSSLQDAGVPITFGSDAHEASDVGRDFEAAVSLAKRVGYERLCVFSKRRRQFVEF